MILPSFLFSQSDSLQKESVIDSISYYQAQLEHFSVSAGIGYKQNTSNTKEYIERNGKVNVWYFSYPYDFDASFSFKNSTKNNVTEQNINSLDISIDQYLKRNHRMYQIPGFYFHPEVFLFFQRSTNQYMAVKQKYETGGGLIFNLFSSKTVQDDAYISKLDKLYSSISPAKRDDLDNLLSAHNARYKRMRIALLVGILSQSRELEYASSVSVNGADSSLTVDINPNSRFLLELRPSFSYYITKEISLDIQSYFEFPLINQDTYPNYEPSREWYAEVPLSLRYKPGIIVMELSYALYYRNQTISQNVETSEGIQNVKLPFRHHNFDFTVGVSF